MEDMKGQVPKELAKGNHNTPKDLYYIEPFDEGHLFSSFHMRIYTKSRPYNGKQDQKFKGVKV